MYRAPREARHSGESRKHGQPRQQPRYADEEEASDYEGSFDEGDFEMLSANRRGTGSSRSSRRPEVNKCRIKVHADDVRYIQVGIAIEFPDLVEKIRDKFGIRRRFKLKIKDEDMPEGDMITMGDQDDLEMAMSSSKSIARKQRQEIAKMEVCYSVLKVHSDTEKASRFGLLKFRRFYTPRHKLHCWTSSHDVMACLFMLYNLLLIFHYSCISFKICHERLHSPSCVDKGDRSFRIIIRKWEDLCDRNVW